MRHAGGPEVLLDRRIEPAGVADDQAGQQPALLGGQGGAGPLQAGAQRPGGPLGPRRRPEPASGGPRAVSTAAVRSPPRGGASRPSAVTRWPGSRPRQPGRWRAPAAVHSDRAPLAVGVNALRVRADDVRGEVSARAGAGSSRPYQVIVRQVDHISRLIGDLLDVERVVSGNVRLNRQPIDMADAIRQVVDAAAGDVAAADRQISLSTEPVWVEWDAVRLQQVATNLLTNAVKYTPAGGQIRVAVRAEGDAAVLSVEDTGFGIAPALLPVIFDMFVQADRTLDQSKDGLGIGLALVRRLVEMHGGTVVASSDGEGRGSTFTLRLTRIPAPHQPSVSPIAEERRTRSRRVLVIEDSSHARQRLRMMFELAGHVVYDAPDVERGLELVKTVSPDVGIIDFSSPVVDRRLVARRFREAPHGRMMVLVAVGPLACGSGANGPSADGFDFHFANAVDVEHLARLLSSGGPQAQAAAH